MKWIDDNVKKDENATLILDDLGRDMNADTAEIFSVGSHHKSCNVCFVVHNLFDSNKAFRQISLNTRYLVIMKNPRDSSTIINFARQFDPANGKRLVQIYRNATSQPFTYLFVDLDQKTSEANRLRSNIFFEGGSPMTIYVRSDVM